MSYADDGYARSNLDAAFSDGWLVDCPDCAGEGNDSDIDCPRCKGEGCIEEPAPEPEDCSCFRYEEDEAESTTLPDVSPEGC